MFKSKKTGIIAQNDAFSNKENDALEQSVKQIKELKIKIAHLEGINSTMPDPYYVRDMDYNIVIWPLQFKTLQVIQKQKPKGSNVTKCLKR